MQAARNARAFRFGSVLQSGLLAAAFLNLPLLFRAGPGVSWRS